MTASRSTTKPLFRAAMAALSLNALALGTVTCGLALTTVAAQAQSQASIITGQSEFEALIGQGAKLIDVRSPAAYAEGHVAGAINLPWQSLNVSESDGIRNEFASDAEFERLLGEAGLSYDDTILIYDTTALPGRAYVAFVYAGFDNVHVLDGGIGVWQGALSQDVPQVAATTFALDRKNDIRVDKDYVASKVGDESAVIIDGRNLEAFEDGHIPGAQALPASSLLTSTATLKSQPVLQRLLDSAGVSQDREVVSYCGSGVAAANNYLALRNQGYDNVVLYDASWDEWSRDPRAGQQVSLANYTFEGTPLAGNGPAFLDEAAVKVLAADPTAVVLDVRSPSDYAAGHIPGSVNVFWDDTFDGDRVLKSVEELQALYTAAGVTPDKRVVIFTRGGLQLSHSFTVLNLLGYGDIDFFTGKFEGWQNGAFRPAV
ncbi:3-mercaptopyruvate sulfurtransferase SseA, contains two rhodanese domains [Devosia sp. YR412]|uniref:rhodanese-like domain-containing protein n=1 Tax=Devosia sp. YR412 TaxID=1881030 RepID=UPI0008AD4502|nr:rhodanese-like domain-containing protein [Devosia sp. YR412]SEQ53080.1 3-mercaptopyruvate sulfurtransferase SseA, contains two rhodanese domains [Devosia sp. YR412]